MVDPVTGSLAIGIPIEAIQTLNIYKTPYNAQYGGFSGGFIGSTAFDGERVYGATALGDFGRFEGFGSLGCMPLQTNADGNLDLLIRTITSGHTNGDSGK